MANLTRDELKKQIDDGKVVVIESLPQEKFAEGHLPGAIRLTAAEVQARAAEILKDKGQQIVTYCANENCDACVKTAEELKKLGYTNVSEYRGGKEDWQKAGLPLEKAG